jgi:excisionase family DNA binding protein
MEIRGTHPDAHKSATVSAGTVRRIETDRDDLHELLTVDEVAALLKVSKSWVYEHTRSHGTPRSERLPYIKVGKYLRFEARAIRAFIEKQCRRT